MGDLFGMGQIGAASIDSSTQIGMAFLQNALNKAAIDRQNTYNSPLNQQLRLKAAGLNPNLMYSQGNVGSQPSPQEMVVPHFSLADSVGKIIQLHNARKQGEIMGEEKKLTHQRYLNETQNVVMSQLMNEKERHNQQYYAGMADYQNAVRQSDATQRLRSIAESEGRIKAIAKDVEIKDEVLRREQYHNRMRQYGVEPHDAFPYRLGALGVNYLTH